MAGGEERKEGVTRMRGEERREGATIMIMMIMDAHISEALGWMMAQ